MQDRVGSLRYGLAALALVAGIAAATGQGAAWADTEGADSGASGGVTHSAPASTKPDGKSDTKPESSADSKDADSDAGTESPTREQRKNSREADRADETDKSDDERAGSQRDAEPARGAADAQSADAQSADEEAAEAAPVQPTAAPEPTATPEVTATPEATPEPTAVPEPTATTEPTPTTEPTTVPEPTATPELHPTHDSPAIPDAVQTVQPTVPEPDSGTRDRAVTGEHLSAQNVVIEASKPELRHLSVALLEPRITAEVEPPAAATAAVTEPTTVDTLVPSPPQPLSPIAKLLQLPGRIVHAVLQVLGFTETAHGPSGLFPFAPINDLIFAVFREVERFFGLHRTPVQQVVPALTYTGPTDAQTPTVAQFLNAAAAAYTLGGVPGGLVPLTENGFQLASTNIFNGMSAKAWVTPERQIIIAYQGTTGGTNLLFSPLMAISQLITDIQVIFTNTTPWAFHDALRFARRVEAVAVAQGYTADDIFVTGHSLGGWEASYVAQQTGWGGIGFESPGLNSTVPGNGAGSNFVNIETYGDPAAYMATDLPGLQPFMPDYVPGGGSKPHYGSIVMIGDPSAATPMVNASRLWGSSIIGSLIFMVDFLGNFFQYHLPGVQAHHLGVTPDPGVVTWLGRPKGPTDTLYGGLTIPQLMLAASDAGRLFRP